MKVLTELDNGHPPEESDLDVVLREASIVSEEKVSKPVSTILCSASSRALTLSAKEHGTNEGISQD